MINILNAIQTRLVAQKGKTNDFGGFKYRSAESILEAVKPLLLEFKAALTLSDEIVQVGDHRYYVKATATLRSTESEGCVQTSAFAREAENKKGMDDSQCTGSASSYARKYALCGLLAIDDSAVDPDTAENDIARCRARIDDASTLDELRAVFAELAAAKPHARDKIKTLCEERKAELQCNTSTTTPSKTAQSPKTTSRGSNARTTTSAVAVG